MKSNKKLYWILTILSVAGYAWLGFQMIIPHSMQEGGLTLCMFKNVTGIPCPSCGITRALLMLLAGEPEKSLMLNPLGIIAGLALLILPIWMIVDALTLKNTLAKVFFQAEHKLKTQKVLYIPLFACFLINWGWNIFKGL